jgi:hypothetical protein
LSTVDSPTPRLNPATRGRIARKALLALGIPTTLCCAAALLVVESNPQVCKGVLLGHLLAQLLTAIWIVGALVTFDRSHTAFFGATVGQAPLRFVLVLSACYVSAQYLDVELTALALTLLVTMVYGHVVQLLTFDALGKALDANELKSEI